MPSLRQELMKLAKTVPETRKHLLPLIRKQAANNDLKVSQGKITLEVFPDLDGKPNYSGFVSFYGADIMPAFHAETASQVVELTLNDFEQKIKNLKNRFHMAGVAVKRIVEKELSAFNRLADTPPFSEAAYNIYDIENDLSDIIHRDIPALRKKVYSQLKS